MNLSGQNAGINREVKLAGGTIFIQARPLFWMRSARFPTQKVRPEPSGCLN